MKIYNTMPEQSFTYKYYKWCDSGYDSCKEEKDENGKVTITWSKGGKPIQTPFWVKVQGEKIISIEEEFVN